MADKGKRRARELAERTGLPYQRVRQLLQRGTSPEGIEALAKIERSMPASYSGKDGDQNGQS